MEKIGRERRSESTWREIVARQAQSGLSVQAFCEQESIKAASFYVWRSRVRRGIRDERDQPRAPRKTRPEKATGEFIDLGSLGSGHSRYEVRLDLGGGVLLHLVRS